MPDLCRLLLGQGLPPATVATVLTCVVLGAWAPGAEPTATAPLAVPSQPQAVVEDTVGGQAVTWIDWGAAGPARLRDPQLISEDHERLRRFLRSPELRADAIALADACSARSVAALRSRLEAWQQDYATREQTTALPCGSGVEHEVVALPPWAWGLPSTIRATTQVLVFDDRDPRQRAWVLRQAADDGRASFAYCTAWTSGEDRDRFWSAHPLLGIHPVASEQFAVFYGLTAYPARVQFGSETMTIDQGLEP